MKDERVKASGILTGPEVKEVKENKAELIEALREALYLSKIVSYAQGFAQMRAASDEYEWDLKYGEISMIFRGGCIIRVAFLYDIISVSNRIPHLIYFIIDSFL